MKILHIVDLISQERAGGSAKVPFELAQYQARLGHDVAIYASDYDAEQQVPPEGVELVKFKCLLNLLGGVRIAPSILLGKFRLFDILHLHNYRTFVNLVAASQGMPYVLQAHGSCWPITSFSKPMHDFIWRRMILKPARSYIADAPMEVQQYVAEGADKEKVVWIPVGIDLDRYQSLPDRRTNEYKTILYVGRFHYLKGVDILLKAIAHLHRKDVRVVLAGIDYGFARQLDLLIDNLGISGKVKQIGQLTEEQKKQAYVDADVLVVPSRYEMWGLVFMEALACGTPVVMSDQCMAADLLPPVCGQAVELDDIAMAHTINAMLDGGFRMKHEEARRQWVSQFGWMSLAPRYLELYGEVVNV